MSKSIIIPAYNEAAGIKKVILECKKVCNKSDEIIVVDDGSTDNTVQIAKKLGVNVVCLSKNQGKANALKKGFLSAKKDILITIDADCTYPPNKIPALENETEKFDLVIGTRFKGKWPRTMPFARVFANKAGAFVTSLILLRKVSDVTSGLRAFKKKLVNEALRVEAQGLDFEAEFTSRVISHGYSYGEVKISVAERAGKSSLKFFRDLFRFFIAVLRGRFSK